MVSMTELLLVTVGLAVRAGVEKGEDDELQNFVKAVEAASGKKKSTLFARKSKPFKESFPKAVATVQASLDPNTTAETLEKLSHILPPSWLGVDLAELILHYFQRIVNYRPLSSRGRAKKITLTEEEQEELAQIQVHHAQLQAKSTLAPKKSLTEFLNPTSSQPSPGKLKKKWDDRYNAPKAHRCNH
jgi:hypothetical protein